MSRTWWWVIAALLLVGLVAVAGWRLISGGGMTEQTLIPAGAMWRYEDSGNKPDRAWRDPAFDDTGWATGQAPLGYGQAVTTQLSFGDDPANKPMTAYFRTAFEAEAGIQGLELGIRRDDGAVVYLNGNELFRTNLPPGPVGHRTAARYAVDDGATTVPALLPADGLVAGTNVLAVAVHQNAPDSSDLIFDLSLTTSDEGPSVAAATPVPPDAMRVTAAGDIGLCGGAAPQTAELVEQSGGPFWALGDIAYPKGATVDFADCYDPFFGELKPNTSPVPGNHEYMQPNARPYFAYFGDRAGTAKRSWYSQDIGAWHVVHLNSNCSDIGGCGPDTPQLRWLRRDLAATDATCIAATWHHPRWSSSEYGDDPEVAPLYQALQDAGGDLILNGHAHMYERFARLDSDGNPDPTAPREIVVGTGGTGLYAFATIAAHSQIRWNAGHGVLQLDLRPDGYDWVFLPTDTGVVVDSGSDTC